MNFTKFLSTHFLTERLRWLFLKKQSDFQTKDLRRERRRGLRIRLPTKTVLKYPALMLSSRRDHCIDVSDNIYGCISGLSCRCFFRIMNFSDRFRQFFKLFYSFQREMFINFLEFRKKYSRKTAR